jgi:hypothetical protein
VIFNVIATVFGVVLGLLTFGLPGALAGLVVIGGLCAFDSHKRRVEQAQPADYPARPGPLQHQHFGE